MNSRELILLSPYRLPTQSALMLANDDVACFLNGYTALWHPAALREAAAPPRIGSPYDYEQPTAGHVYAVPDTPPLVLPDDWEQRVRDAGAFAFRAVPDRGATLANLHAALGTSPADGADPGPFFGLGFGYVVVEALHEAMDHQNLLSAAEFWQDVQQAVAAFFGGDAEAVGRHLRAAAEKLLAAREVLYSATLHLLDIAVLDEARASTPLPASFELGLPLNLIASAAVIEKMPPERVAELRQRLASETVEVCGGPYREREDALLPVESQLWNLTRGLARYKELLDAEVRVHARKRSAVTPQTPLFLQSAGLSRALLVAFDDAVLPTYRSPVINWPSPDGKQVEAFARVPYAADNPQTFFHAAHYLHKTIMEDHGATFALAHQAGSAAPWYRDWLELSLLAPVLGRWTTFSRYFNDVLAGEYASAVNADEFHADYLSERTNAHSPEPVSWFARQVRARRQLDTAWTLTALHRGLSGDAGLTDRLRELEEETEAGRAADPSALVAALDDAGEALAQRLLARATSETPGYLVLNPCSFTRRLALELDDLAGPLPLGGPLKAFQLDADKGRLVVEVPALGFAWLPRAGPPGTPPPPHRMRLADGRTVRNEFFEAEVDPATGGLRALRDHRARINRIAQQLVYNPGHTTQVRSITVTSAGPALGEIVSEGALLDDQGQELATFRQRFRAWLGRPVLDLRIEITPRHAPAGYPWHAYYGSRFAWRDERASLLRGVNGTAYVTSHTRPETPDYLEVRLGAQNVVILPGGLPFHQRHGSRMLDVILIPEGETTTVFDLAVGLDREYPMQTALGMVTPTPVVRTAKGPPHVGASGWLFHLDAPNLLLTSLRPAPDGADSVVARLLECSSHTGHAELRCARDPRRAVLLDARGGLLGEAQTQGDAVMLDVSQGDLVHLRVEF